MSLEDFRRYYFTSTGDVYSGFRFDEWSFEDYLIVIQSDKRYKFEELSGEKRTLDKIKEYGWAIPKNTIKKVLHEYEFVRPSVKSNSTWFNGSIDRKNMFIFGAGASANCVSLHQKESFEGCIYRPPLGNELFAPRFKPVYRKYDGVGLSLFDLQQKNANVEEYLEYEWQEVVKNGNNNIITRHINIQFYLQEILKDISVNVIEDYSEANLFSKFAHELQIRHSRNPKQHFAIVSFNQDSIIDHFMSRHFKKHLQKMDDYIEVNNNPFCIFKPHGSWNWGWQYPKDVSTAANGNIPAWLYEVNANFYDLYYRILGNHTNMIDWDGFGVEAFLHNHQVGKFTIDKSQIKVFDTASIKEYYPALLLPYRDKDEFTMPLKHYYHLTGYLNNVENLFIIGWKGNEASFIKLLNTYATKIKKVILVDPNPHIVETNLKCIIAKDGIEVVHYSGFEDFIFNGLSKEIR